VRGGESSAARGGDVSAGRGARRGLAGANGVLAITLTSGRLTGLSSASTESNAVSAAKLTAVCTENSVRIDLATESLNVSDDGRAVMLLPGAVRLAV
jgi:hypothetical protein